MNLLKRTLSVVWDVIETSTFALAFTMVTYLFLFQTGEVHGASSYPTWQENEKFITDKISYRFNAPQRGDFIVFTSPRNPDVDFIKRIIGLPQETIKVTSGKVYINEQLLSEPYLQRNTVTSGNVNIVIPAEYYFVMGDNRSNSSDSRDFGPISEKSIVGKVALRFWPPDKFGTIH